MQNKEKIIKKTSGRIAYKGTVTIDAVDKKGRVRRITQHNKGMQGMFNFLLFCMAYNYIGDFAPTYIMGYTGEGMAQEAFITPIPINNTPNLYRKEGSGYVLVNPPTPPVNKVQYSAIVPSTRFKNSQTVLTGLKLFNNYATNPGGMSDSNCCAELALTTTEITLADENLLIYWDIEFIEEENVETSTLINQSDE